MHATQYIQYACIEPYIWWQASIKCGGWLGGWVILLKVNSYHHRVYYKARISGTEPTETTGRGVVGNDCFRMRVDGKAPRHHAAWNEASNQSIHSKVVPLHMDWWAAPRKQRNKSKQGKESEWAHAFTKIDGDFAKTTTNSSSSQSILMCLHSSQIFLSNTHRN